MENPGAVILALAMIILPLMWKPSRKAMGLLNIIVGAVFSLTGIGLIIGIPLIFVGGILLFV